MALKGSNDLERFTSEKDVGATWNNNRGYFNEDFVVGKKI